MLSSASERVFREGKGRTSTSACNCHTVCAIAHHVHRSCSLARQPASARARRIPPKDIIQTLAVSYWTFHYAKRIFETFFVHRHIPSSSHPKFHVLGIPPAAVLLAAFANGAVESCWCMCEDCFW